MNTPQTTTTVTETLVDVDLGTGTSSDQDVLSFIDASKCIVKIVDVANNASFNALSIGHDFQVRSKETHAWFNHSLDICNLIR